MKDQTNADEDGNEALKYTSGNLSQHFLFFYKDLFEKQLEFYLKAVVGKEDQPDQPDNDEQLK
jgi:hypothetical protein